MNILLTEVGLRDGIQAEQLILPTADKVRLANALIAAGVRSLEATSFVSPQAVPQLADADDVIRGIKNRDGVQLCALVPNARGMHRAARAGVEAVLVFLSASESHNRKNLNRSVDESLRGIQDIADIAAESGIEVKGAIATAFGCPFEGDIATRRVVDIARAFRAVGVHRITLGDTTGMATPRIVRTVCSELLSVLPDLRIALHFHNTRGMAMVNVAEGLSLGITEYESSLGGTGGCPFAPGATGNICSEDLVHYLAESGHETGIDLAALCATARELEALLGRPLPGQVMRVGPRGQLYPLESVRTASGCA